MKAATPPRAATEGLAARNLRNSRRAVEGGSCIMVTHSSSFQIGHDVPTAAVRLTASAKATAVRRSFTRRRKPDTTYRSHVAPTVRRVPLQADRVGPPFLPQIS